jgi:hypothetical protein
LIKWLPDDAVVFFSDEVHFHISGCVNGPPLARYFFFLNYVI